VRAVTFRVRCVLRRRIVAALGVAALVAIVSGAVLTIAGGASRTASAPARYTTAAGGDPSALVEQRAGPPLDARIAALPGVRSVDAMTFVFGEIVDPQHRDANTLTFAGRAPVNARVIAGRHASTAHEFVGDTSFVAAHHARLGSRFRLVSWTQDQLRRGQAFEAPPAGPSFDAVLVGIADSPGKLESSYSVAVFAPTLLRTEIGTVATEMAVRLEPGTTLGDLRRELDRLPQRADLDVTSGRIVSAEVRTAVDAQARGLWLMAAVGAIAAIVALGQLLARHVSLPGPERATLTAIGVSRGQQVAESVLRAAVPVASGLVLGIALATFASRIFPTGFARALEPHPGSRLDGVILALAAVLVLCVLAWVATATVFAVARTSGRRTETAPAPRRIPLVDPAAATGTRFALGGNGTTRAVGTLCSLAAITAGIAAATVFAASLERLVSDRARFGGNYTFQVGENSNMSAAQLKATLARDGDIGALMILSESQARSGATTVPLVGVERVRGELAPRVLSGRFPEGTDELAIGRVTERDLRVRVGDRLDLVGRAGRAGFRVVGTVVVPTIGGNDGVGAGAVVTSDGLARLEHEPTSSIAAVMLRSDAPASAERHIGELTNARPGTEDVPASVLNVARVRRIPGALAGLLAAMLLITLVHAVVAAVRRRRRDLAVLRTLGADRRWLARAVRWQASVLTAVPVAIGIPLGVVAGAAVFRAFVDRIGAVPDPALPLVLLSATGVGLVVLGDITASITWRTRRGSTAAALRSE
jgi:ABC-type lipoprotein release transport system permease subunit